MKAEEICRPENRGNEYCWHGGKTARVSSAVGLRWTDSGDAVSVRFEFLTGWAPVEPDPPQPQQRIEEWDVYLDRHKELCAGSGCRGLFVTSATLSQIVHGVIWDQARPQFTARWLGYYIYKLPTGVAVKSPYARMFWRPLTEEWHCPAHQGTDDVLLTPTAVPMLVEEGE